MTIVSPIIIIILMTMAVVRVRVYHGQNWLIDVYKVGQYVPDLPDMLDLWTRWPCLMFEIILLITRRSSNLCRVFHTNLGAGCCMTDDWYESLVTVWLCDRLMQVNQMSQLFVFQLQSVPGLLPISHLLTLAAPGLARQKWCTQKKIIMTDAIWLKKFFTISVISC